MEKNVASNLLIQEVNYFCNALVNQNATDYVVKNYASAHKHINLQVSEKELNTITDIMGSGKDILAIEFALRLLKKNNPITKKFQILIYLMENDPKYINEFINREEKKLFAWVAAVELIIVDSIRAVKGLWLAWRLNLV